MKFNLRIIWLIVGSAILTACGSSKSPVVVRETISREIESERLGGRIITIIQAGDTWHGVAFANNLTTSELAAWNGMSDQDTLQIGQRLRLTKPLGFELNNSNLSASHTNTNSTSVTQKKIISVKPAQSRQQRANSSLNSSTKVSQKPGKPEKIVIKTPKQSPVERQFNQKNLRWTWPLQGPVVNKFSPNQGRKGIDISGRQNQAVKVAAPGKVVYQGNGVKGYRNLIIVKHSEDLLSAYAHNEQVYVQEGQWVKENQTISTVGLKKGQPLLHFEIRRKGKPVDPLKYLGG